MLWISDVMERQIIEWKWITSWNEYGKYYPWTWLEGLRKTAKQLNEDSLHLGRDLNSGPLKYEAGMLYFSIMCKEQCFIFYSILRLKNTYTSIK
jgi:hypothetical protein